MYHRQTRLRVINIQHALLTHSDTMERAMRTMQLELAEARVKLVAMRNRVLENSLLWTVAFVLKDVALFVWDNTRLAHQITALTLLMNACFLVTRANVRSSLLVSIVWWCFLCLIVVIVCLFPREFVVFI